jgi:hypothetical protein
VLYRTEPPEPAVGKRFTVFLKPLGKETGPCTIQYRPSPSVPWQDALEGKVSLPELKPGPLILEIRVLDSRGQPSPLLIQKWTPLPAPEVVRKPRPGLKKGDRIFQEVIVSRQSTCSVLGIDVRDQAVFALLSSLRVEEAAEDGPRVVRQKVESVRLDRADPALQGRLNALLQKTRGASFRLTLGAGGEVLKFEGDKVPFALAVGGASAGELSFLLQSTLDPDAWKEFAQLTFLRPPDPLPRGGQWTRKMAHQWGPLGSWAGQVAYRPTGKAGRLDRFDYMLGLTYSPPGVGGGLPFQVSKADFRLLAGGGNIMFDVTRGRTVAAEERFHVRGVLAATALGATSTVALEEVQMFRLRILDELPPGWQP